MTLILSLIGNMGSFEWGGDWYSDEDRKHGKIGHALVERSVTNKGKSIVMHLYWIQHNVMTVYQRESLNCCRLGSGSVAVELGVGGARAVNWGKSLPQRNLGGATIRIHRFVAVVCSSQVCVLHHFGVQGGAGLVLLVHLPQELGVRPRHCLQPGSGRVLLVV